MRAPTKLLRTVFPPLVATGLLLALAAAPAAGQDGGQPPVLVQPPGPAAELLVAPLFPGAVALPHPTRPARVEGEAWHDRRNDGIYSRTYLVPARPEEVRAFYEERIGPLERMPDERTDAYRRVDRRMVFDDDAVAGMLGLGWAGGAGVDVVAVSEEAVEDGPLHWPFLADFPMGVRAMDEALKDPGLRARARKLALSFYPYAGEVDADLDEVRRLDEVHLERCRPGGGEGAMDMEALSREMEKAVAAGDFDRVMELQEQAAEAGEAMMAEYRGEGGTERMEDCFAGLEPHAYGTLLVVHLHPEHWPRLMEESERWDRGGS